MSQLNDKINAEQFSMFNAIVKTRLRGQETMRPVRVTARRIACSEFHTSYAFCWSDIELGGQGQSGTCDFSYLLADDAHLPANIQKTLD